MLYILIIVLSILVIVLGFGVYNLLKKLETSEDIIVNYLIYLDQISRIIEVSDTKIKKLDYRGIFSSDDEIGYFFKSIKEIQDILNKFKLKEIK